MKQIVLFFSVMILAAFTGCNGISNPTSTTVSSGAVYMWIAPIADTKVDADYPDQNFSTAGDLTIARFHIPGNVAWHVTSYVKYQLPDLPSGTKIDEAYFEVYHSGTTEDGTADNTRFDVSPVGIHFGADTITWNNGPDKRMAVSGINPWGVILHSNDWCGTTDISDTIRSWFADSTKNSGFRIAIGDPQNWYKSFYSNNSFIGPNNSGGRTDSTLGKAPRLLVKIELPDGKTTKDITWSSLESDNDIKLGAFTLRNGYVWMADYASGTDWPAIWGVKKGQ